MEAAGWTHGQAEKEGRRADAESARKALAAGSLRGRMKPKHLRRLAKVLDGPDVAGRIHVLADAEEAKEWISHFALNANMGLLGKSWNGKARTLKPAAEGRAGDMVDAMTAKGWAGTAIMDARTHGLYPKKRHRWHFLLIASGVPGLEFAGGTPSMDRARKSAPGTFFLPSADSMERARNDLTSAISFLSEGVSCDWIGIHDSSHDSAKSILAWFDRLEVNFAESNGWEECKSDKAAASSVTMSAIGCLAVVNQGRAWGDGVPQAERARVDFMLNTAAWEFHKCSKTEARALRIAAHELLGHVGAEGFLSEDEFESMTAFVDGWSKNPRCRISRKFAVDERAFCDADVRKGDRAPEQVARFMETAAVAGVGMGLFAREPDFHGALGRLAAMEDFAPEDALDIGRGGLRRALARTDEFGIVVPRGDRFPQADGAPI